MRKSSEVEPRILLFSLVLVVVGVAGLLDPFLNVNPNIGFLCGFEVGKVRCALYTVEYSARVYFKTAGIYHQEKQVFFLELENGSLIRLIFYCKQGTLVTVRDLASSGGYEFCENVPFQDGVVISVDGTLITPSQLSNRFIGDLYVFEM